MKKILILLWCAVASQSFGQTESRQIALNIGATHNFNRFVHKVAFRNFDTEFDFIPGGMIGLDWSLWSAFSLGFSFVGQQHVLSIKNYEYINALGNTVVENPTMTLFIGGGQVRGLIHPTDWVDTDILDFYVGVQYTSIFYTVHHTSSDPSFHNPRPPYQNIPSGVIGLRFYPVPQIGLFTEAAFPGPYTLSAGICIRNEPKPFNWGFPFRFLND